MPIPTRAACIAFAVIATILALPIPSHAQIMLSGNENKIDLTGGGQAVVPNPAPDNLTLLDFSAFPPKTWTLNDLPNSVIGPPSNIGISPDGRLALVANSVRIEGSKWVPESYVHVLDLSVRPPRVVGKVQTDAEPSGLSFTPDGRMALVANRAAGTVSVLSIDGFNLKVSESVKVCEPADNVSDVAISPDGKMALASVQKASYLAVLRIDNGKVISTGRKISAFGQPYRCVITPDGQYALTAGAGFGTGADVDAVTVVDLKGEPRAIDYIPVGVSPESLEISPDGKLLAVVVIEGSNKPPTDANHGKAGALVILQRHDNTFVKTQRLPVGRIPEGVAFTGDGRYLVVQCHPDRQLWIFEVKDGKVQDTGQRVSVPGMPSSLRAARAR